MSPLKPLLFLTYKSIFNGLKRALTTPRRLITFLFFLGYYFMIFVRPAMAPRAGMQPLPNNLVGKFDFPPLQVIDSFVFAVFLVLSLFMGITISSYQGSFRPADVDVLFATPVPPRAVLWLRIARDYLFTLLTPFFIAVIGLRASRMGWEAVFRNFPHPEYSGVALRAMTISWLLMAMCFVAITHAVSLFINRSDIRSDRNKLLLDWGIGLFLLGWGGFIGWRIAQHPDAQHIVALAQWPVLRIVFFIATFATEMAMSPFYGDWKMVLLGAGGMLATIAVFLRIALSQVSWLYDQAAAKGFATSKSRQMQRMGDYSGMMAERARSGKYKVRKFATFHRLRMQGSSALIWKELFLQPRTILPVMLMMGGSQIVVSLLPALSSFASEREAGIMLIAMQGFLTMMVTMVLAQTGFVEVLKRVDLQKPLPFKAGTIVFYETLARSALGLVCSWLGVIAVLIVKPAIWQYGLAAAIFTPCISILFSSIIFFVTMLFPDLEDASQRQFRGLMMLFGFAIGGFIPALVMIGLLALKINPVIPAFTSGALSIGVAAILSAISGQLYATFNPSE